MTFEMRLVAYEPNGARLGILPAPLSVNVALPLNDVSSLQISYSSQAVGAEILDDPIEVAIEVWDGADWVEPADCRFVRLGRSFDITDDTGRVDYSLPGYAWMLRKALLYPEAVPDPDDGKRHFTAATPGTIIDTVLDEAQARDAADGFTLDGDATNDAEGVAWEYVLDIAYDPGVDVLTILTDLADNGAIDWQMSGRQLRILNPNTALSRDLTTEEPVVDVRLGRDVTGASDQGTYEDGTSVVLVLSDESLSLELANEQADVPWGRWETVLSQRGVSDATTASQLAQVALDSGARERLQVTRDVVFDAAVFLPLVDYLVGDYILAPGSTGGQEALRLRQVTFNQDQNGQLTGNLTLNDRFIEREIRLAKLAKGIVREAPESGGGGAAPQTFVKTYNATWSATYEAGGTPRVGGDAGRIYQGTFAGSAHGNQKSMIGFPFSQIATDLTGATVTKTELYLYFAHWFNGSGGTAVLGTHNSSATSAPGTFAGTSNRLTSASWPKPGGRWVDLTSTVTTEFQAGTSKGIVVGPGNSSSDLYYGYANGATLSNPPQLRITYTVP